MNKFSYINIKNKNVYNKYYIENEIDAGLVLNGWEILSLKKKEVNIDNSYINIISNEVFLIKSIFNIINNKETNKYNSNRNRKLLLKKKEIYFLKSKIKIKNFTIVPIFIFWNENSFAKIKIGISKGKTKIDKRLKIKNRDWNIKKLTLLKYNNKII